MRLRPGVVMVTAATATAVAGRVVFGARLPGYDAAWSVVWGRAIAAGEVPQFVAPVAPTPHPLSNAVASVAIALPGDAPLDVLSALSWLSYGALGVAVFVLARRLGGAWCGVIAAALVLTRTLIVGETLIASLDIPFLALVAAATAAAASDPRSVAPLWWLLPAGLLRPEAWLFAGVWALWLGLRGERSRRMRLAALALAGPLLWILSDGLITGDPLFSFTGTRDLADELGRPQSLSLAAPLAGGSVVAILGAATFAAGVAGLLMSMATDDWPPRLVTVLTLVGTVAFLGYGVVGLPVLARYTLVPATGLAVLGAWAVVSVIARPPRRAGMLTRALAVAMLVALSVSMVDQTRRARANGASSERRDEAFASLKDLVTSDTFRADTANCRTLLVSSYRAVPLVAIWSDRDVPRGVAERAKATPSAGAIVLPASRLVGILTALDARDANKMDRHPPQGWSFRGGNIGWSWYKRGC